MRRVTLGLRRRLRWALWGLGAGTLMACAGTAWWHGHKPLPVGLRVEGPRTAIDPADVVWLADTTTVDSYGTPLLQQQIFANTLAMVAEARQFLVLDYFLFNDHRGPLATPDPRLQPLSAQLQAALLDVRQREPQLPVLLLVDPINLGYGKTLTPPLQALQAAGVQVVVTDLDLLRDSNPVWSAPWRLLGRWWLRTEGEGSLGNPLDADGPPVTVGALARLLNFKANHRKLVLTGDGAGGLRGLLTSANPHDASSAHSNVGLSLRGEALRPLLQSELAIARGSGWQGQADAFEAVAAPPVNSGSAQVPAEAWAQVLTEGAIRDAVLRQLQDCNTGDAVDIAQFYLSDRGIIRALLQAAARGAQVQVLLDPNKDAFGHEKSGIPNRQVAAELVGASNGAVHVRWYRTHGEQFHAKLMMVRRGERVWLTAGSANFTRRNLRDFNLEANLAVELPSTAPAALAARQWFDQLWGNRVPAGVEYSAHVDLYADPSSLRYGLYRFMEWSGMSTF
jgi:hypothetical protein